jgi:hypothetical protein
MKIAITGLVRGYSICEEYNELIFRNQLIYDVIYKNNESKFDIILFHEGNILLEHQIYLQSRTPNLPLQFINVSAEFDSKLIKTTSRFCSAPHSSADKFHIGYYHMCRFWIYAFLRYVTNYETIIRIDEDCFIQDFPLDICTEMVSKKIYFISAHFQGEDNSWFTEGIKEMTEEFIKNNNLECVPCYNYNPYTNIFIINTLSIKNLDLHKKWCDMLEDAGGIYVNRWGDLPLWGITLSLFFDKNNIYHDTRIKYYHASHIRHINY